MAEALVEPTTIILLWTEYQTSLQIHVLTHRSVQPSDIIREVPLCNGWWIVQKLTTGQSVEYQWSIHLQMGQHRKG